jgi:hypothetical protein
VGSTGWTTVGTVGSGVGGFGFEAQEARIAMAATSISKVLMGFLTRIIGILLVSYGRYYDLTTKAVAA